MTGDSPTSASVFTSTDPTNEKEMQLDDCSVIKREDQVRDDSQRLEGEMHLIYSHVYECVALYLRLWDSSTGQLLDHVQVNAIMRKFCKLPQEPEDLKIPSQEQPIDHRIYQHGELLPEMHPLLGSIYLAFHLCEMSDHFKHIISVSVSFKPNNVTVDQKFEEEGESVMIRCDGKLLILQFLQFIARYIAVDISSDHYRELLSIFSEN